MTQVCRDVAAWVWIRLVSLVSQHEKRGIPELVLREHPVKIFPCLALYK